MIKRKFWKPALTSQYMICPIPFHLDTYRGCVYNCSYCFARDFMTFARRNTDHKEFTYLEGNRPDLLGNWFQRTLTKPYNYKRGEEVAFKERIPIKIGGNADPFPPIEAKERITYDVLQALHKLDYPVQMSTKNPSVLLGYVKDFNKPNWAVNVTITTCDPLLAKIIEPNAPSPEDRLEVIRQLTDYVPVFVRIQPTIYPHIMKEAHLLVSKMKRAGVWGFEAEALKVRAIMPKSEQVLYEEMSLYLGTDIREFYKRQRMTGSDYELDDSLKMEYIELFKKLAWDNAMKFFVGDNRMGKVGEGCECCGTQILRDYKIWGNNLRTRYWGEMPNESYELGKVILNFTRSDRKNTEKTLNDAMDEEFEKRRSIFDASRFTI